MDIHGQKLVVVGKILGNEREIHVVSQRITDGEPPIRAFQAGHVHSGGGEGKPLCGGIGNHAHAVPLVHDAHDVRREGRIVKIKDFEDVVEVEQAFFIVPHHLALRHEAFLSDVEKMVCAYGNLEESPAVEKFFQRLVIGELSPQVVSFDVACPGSACHEFVAALYACHDLVVESLDCSVMQESGGQGTDPMQASECGYNTRYPNTPNGITDPEYSIDVGIQNLAACLREAGVESPVDMNNIKLALQGYNYGNGYISWAKENYGGYTYANAVEFSEMMAERNGWSSYGDKEYVSHVLRYYAFGRIPTGTGSQAIVQVALTQEGNGGDTYWSWYGFSSREEWCACFVSWCADQCGYIEAGVIPKFSLCSAGMEWFESRGQFMDGSYVPAAGDIVFFDWENDGSVDHVGIVESVVDGNIYTVEGNSGDKVARRSYPIGYGQIVGFGVPAY